jgi:biopolymer transport protein ExbB/TolQ
MLSASIIDTSNFWFNYIAGVGFAAGTVWAVIAFVHRRFIRQVSNLVGKEVKNDLAQKISKEVEHIYKETTHNGGSSMKDAVSRLEKRQSEGFEKIDKQIESMERYIQKLDKAIERHLGYHEGHDE